MEFNYFSSQISSGKNLVEEAKINTAIWLSTERKLRIYKICVRRIFMSDHRHQIGTANEAN